MGVVDCVLVAVGSSLGGECRVMNDSPYCSFCRGCVRAAGEEEEEEEGEEGAEEEEEGEEEEEE